MNSAASETYDQLVERLAQEGHGHVVPRKDRKRKCGGPVYCRKCRQEKLFIDQLKEKEGRL